MISWDNTTIRKSHLRVRVHKIAKRQAEGREAVDVQSTRSDKHTAQPLQKKRQNQSVGSMWALATDVLLPCMPPPVTASSSNQCHHLSQEALNTVTSSQLRRSRNVTWRKLYTQKGLPKVGVLMSTLGLVAVIMAGSMFMTQGQVKAHQKKNCICVE